jgi:mannitol/fructose-specific phosphotransferase system IIA component (Ntr-type)
MAFCALDHNSHIESLKLMAQAITQDGFIERVIQAANSADLEKILNTSNL